MKPSDIRIGVTLPNGATVIMFDPAKHVVLAVNAHTFQPFVVWDIVEQSDGTLYCINGSYDVRLMDAVNMYEEVTA